MIYLTAEQAAEFTDAGLTLSDKFIIQTPAEINARIVEALG